MGQMGLAREGKQNRELRIVRFGWSSRTKWERGQKRGIREGIQGEQLKLRAT